MQFSNTSFPKPTCQREHILKFQTLPGFRGFSLMGFNMSLGTLPVPGRLESCLLSLICLADMVFPLPEWAPGSCRSDCLPHPWLTFFPGLTYFQSLSMPACGMNWYSQEPQNNCHHSNENTGPPAALSASGHNLRFKSLVIWHIVSVWVLPKADPETNTTPTHLWVNLPRANALPACWPKSLEL